MKNTYSRIYRLIPSLHKPLENFTTEVFAGILNAYPEIRTDFIASVLKLSAGIDFPHVETQKFYELKGKEPNCLIDLVLKNVDSVCFIENKVNSGEGYKQLERYTEVQATHYSLHNKYLYYCTRYKEEKSDYLWEDVLNLMYKYKQYPQINDFIEFLEYEVMAKTKITFSDFPILSQMKEVYFLQEKLGNYLRSVEKLFEERFENHKKTMGPISWYIKNQNAFVSEFKYLYGNSSDKATFSGIMAGFIFEAEMPQLIVWFWTESKVEGYDALKKADMSPFIVKPLVDGLSFEESEDLQKFIQDDTTLDETKITEWFGLQFDKIVTVIKQNPQVNWQIKVKN